MSAYVSWLGKDAVLSDKREGQKCQPTPEQVEWRYRLEERLAILCEDRKPTQEQFAIAKSEADAWFKQWAEEERKRRK